MKSYLTLVAEAAARPSDHENLGLLVKISPTLFTIIFYDVEEFRATVSSHLASGAKPKKLVDGLRKCLVGSMSLTKGSTAPHGAWTVVFAKAKRGYGPMMYDYAMKRLGAIMSDRNDVSMDARNVWKKYFERRDVVHMPIDDIENPKTPPPEDDGEVFSKDPKDPLNYVYRAVSRSTTEYLPAETRSRNCLQETELLGIPKKNLESYLNQASMDEFSSIVSGAS